MAKQSLYRFSQATVIEPLVNRWSAWANLISPVTASLHLQRHQQTILCDYLKDPATHLRLAHDPDFAGGPFVDIPLSQAQQIRGLMLKTECQLKDNLKLADSIADFYNWFVDEARGQGLEPYYDYLPEEMRGYVELVYDYFNQPSIRFFEGLLYQSKYYDEGLQSLRLFSLRRDSERPFFMSTPRLKKQDEIDWHVAFADPLVDELYGLDLRPQPLQYIAEILGDSAKDQQMLLPLLTEQAGKVAERWRGSAVRLRYFGHACVLVECNGFSLLTDPIVAARPSAGGMERFSYDDLPERIDCVLITHNHQDHFVLETLLRLRPRIECLVAPKASGYLFGDISLKLLGQKLNFKSIIELDAMESLKLMPDIEIVAVPFLGEHGDLAHSKTAYVVRAGHEQIMFAADSNCLDRRMYEYVRRALGPVQTVFIGTECVGAPLTWNNGHLFLRPPTREQDQSRRYRGCDSSGALDLLEALGSKRVFNYAMGREPWLEHLLGLSLSKDSPQLREGQKLVQRAHGRGFLAAESLLGRAEIFLEARGPRQAVPGPARQTNSDRLCWQQSSSPCENWRHYFAGALDVMTPPKEVERFSRSYGTRGLPGESRFERSSLKIASELSEALSEFAAIQECDRYLLFMVAAALLFSSANGQNEVVLDTLLTNENLRLANLSAPDLPKKSVLRIDLSGGLSFTTLIARVHEVVARAATRPELAFDELIGFLREPQSEESNAPFRLKFIFDADGVNASSRPAPAREEILNGLALTIVAEGNSFTAFADFDGEVLNETFVKQLLDDYQSLLRAAICDPQHAIATSSIHGEAQKVFVTGVGQTNDSEDQFIF